MKKNNNPIFYRIFLLLAGVASIILVIRFLIYAPPYTNEQTTLTPSWNGITPGKTILPEVLSMLGEPDKTVQKNGIDIYSYVDRKDLKWHLVEIWIKHDGFNPTVFGILRNFPYLEKGQSLADINTLEQLVLLYGRPQKTSWTFFRTTRYLVWAQDGIATMVDADIRYRSWDKFLVGNVLIFESMSLDQFLQTQWPYKGWEDHNLYIDGDAPDTLPEDPYDWEHMPTPIQ